MRILTFPVYVFTFVYVCTPRGSMHVNRNTLCKWRYPSVQSPEGLPWIHYKNHTEIHTYREICTYMYTRHCLLAVLSWLWALHTYSTTVSLAFISLSPCLHLFALLQLSLLRSINALNITVEQGHGYHWGHHWSHLGFIMTWRRVYILDT